MRIHMQIVPILIFGAAGCTVPVNSSGLPTTGSTNAGSDASQPAVQTVVTQSQGAAPGIYEPVPWPNIGFVNDPAGVDPKTVALSFDDGPDESGNTAYVLDQLKALDLHATFFLCAYVFAALPTDPQAQAMVQRILAEGHDIGNHTAHHPHLETIDPNQVTQEFATDANVLHDPHVLGAGRVLSMYRAPFGSPFLTNMPQVANVATHAVANGVHIGWGIDTNDWQCAQNANMPPLDCIMGNLKAQLNNGQSGIILMHSVYRSSGDALPAMVHELYNRGYRIISVQDYVRHKYGVDSDTILRINANAGFTDNDVAADAVQASSQNQIIAPPY